MTVIPNQGRGAAMKRVEAARRLFPSIWFNADTTESGREALGWYHEKRNEDRDIGLGPEHDWSSHGCLVGGSMIQTDKGFAPIECVRVGDSVVTPAGIAKVLQAGPVKVATSLIRLQLADGRSLDMTPEHKVFTARGLVCADALRHNDSIFTVESETCLELDRVNLMGYRGAFTEYFEGTGWRIWSFLAHPIMRGTTPHLMSGSVARLIKRSYAQLARCLLSGTKAMKVGRGTSHMANLLGNRVNPRGKHAKSADLNTSPSGRVNPGTAVAIVARERVIAQEMVYDLTVEKQHCYFANGVLVSNSDAFGLLCCDYAPPAAEREITYKRRFLA